MTRPSLCVLLGLALAGCSNEDASSTSTSTTGRAEASAPKVSTPTPTPTPTPIVEVSADDYVRGGGPYVPPTIEEGRFRCTREYARGRGKYPVAFSVAIPPGMEVMETERDSTAENLVAFATRTDGKITRYFGIGLLGYHEPNSAVVVSSLEKKLIPDLATQIATMQGGRVDDRGRVSLPALPLDVYRVDILDIQFEHPDYPAGRWHAMMASYARRDGRPHGVIFTMMMHESLAPDVDAVLNDEKIDALMRSFVFE